MDHDRCGHEIQLEGSVEFMGVRKVRSRNKWRELRLEFLQAACTSRRTRAVNPADLPRHGDGSDLRQTIRQAILMYVG